MKKGQYLRLLIGNGVSVNNVPIAAATNMQLHVSVSTENSSTKDDTGDFDVFEPVGISFDISSDALVIDNENANSETNLAMAEELLNDNVLPFSIVETSGVQNREQVEGGGVCYGSVKLTSLSINAQNRQNSSFNASFSGFGELVVVTPSSNSPSNSPAPEVADPVTIDPEEGNDEG